MTLYQINELLERCVMVNDDAAVDTETGEVIDASALDALTMERDEKIEGIALWHKNLVAEAEAVSKEVKRLQARQKAATAKADSLKGYLGYVLNGERFSTPKVAITFRKSEVLSVAADADVPDVFLSVPQPVVDKNGLKKFIKEGYFVKGVELIERQNVQIK